MKDRSDGNILVQIVMGCGGNTDWPIVMRKEGIQIDPDWWWLDGIQIGADCDECG